MPIHLSPDLLYDHTDAVDTTPDDEVPTRAMPKTTKNLRDEGVEVRIEKLQTAYSQLLSERSGVEDSHYDHEHGKG